MSPHHELYMAEVGLKAFESRNAPVLLEWYQRKEAVRSLKEKAAATPVVCSRCGKQSCYCEDMDL